jgi:predicted site-specific integrase-resolvase
VSAHLITTKETCEILGITKPTLWAWAKRGIVTPQVGDRRYWYVKNEIVELARINNELKRKSGKNANQAG